MFLDCEYLLPLWCTHCVFSSCSNFWDAHRWWMIPWLARFRSHWLRATHISFERAVLEIFTFLYLLEDLTAYLTWTTGLIKYSINFLLVTLLRLWAVVFVLDSLLQLFEQIVILNLHLISLDDLLILNILKLCRDLLYITTGLLQELIKEFHFTTHTIFMLLWNVAILDVELLHHPSVISRSTFLFSP